MKPLKRYDIFCIVLLFTLTFILFFSNAKAETSLVEKQYKHSLSDNVSSNLDYIIQNSKGGIGSGFFAQASQDENSAGDDSSQGNESAGDVDLEIIAKKSANPLGDLWMIWIQNDFSILEGELLDDRKVINSTKLQPVMPIPLFGGTWNFIVRPVFQLQSVPLDKEVGEVLGVHNDTIVSDPALLSIISEPFGRTTGLGDTVLLTLIGPNRLDGVIWGVGATQIFPTATDDVLGQKKWQAGPAVLFARMGKAPGDWNIGFLAQHWWSYAGDDDRPDTSQTDIQYFINYKVNKTDLLGMAPNIRINWEADDNDDKFTVPIGIGYSTVTFLGKLPVRLGIEFQWAPIRPESAGTEFNIRLYFIPIIPRPF